MLKKLLLDILLVVCLAAVVYTVYKLFNGGMEGVPGAVITAAGILVLIAGWRLLKRPARRIGGGVLLLYLVIVVIIAGMAGAYGGVTQLAEAKDAIEEKLQGITEGGGSIVGRWDYNGTPPHVMEFTADGIFIYEDAQMIVTGAYEFPTDDYIKITLDGFAGAWQYLFEEDTVRYELDGDILHTFSKGKTATFHRKK